jgi:heat shock protein HslJ
MRQRVHDRPRGTLTAAIVLLALSVIAIAGCGPRAAGSDLPGGRAPVDVVGLLGSWSVSSADGDAVLVLEPHRLEVRAGGATFTGRWRADDGGAFLADVDRVPAAGGSPEPAWLTRATAVAVVDGEPALHASGGGATARLARRDPAPAVSDETRIRLGPASALPASYTPAQAATLTGRWVPADGSGARAPRPAHVSFTLDGRWTGSDGCNLSEGRWTATDGVLLATAGPTTLMACDDMAAVPGWLHAVRRAAFADGVLVLRDVGGAELGRLRAADPAG